MAADDETREAADGTEVQVEAVDLGTVHFEPHPEVKLPSIMEIKNMGETIDSTEGTLKIPEDQVLVEAPSELELPPEHKLNGKASSLNGHVGKEEKISSAQLPENDQEEAELDEISAHQSNGINKEEVIDGLSHGESTTEDSGLLKHEKDEEPRDDRQDSEGVTVDDDLVQEETLKTDNSVDHQKDQNQEPEKANDDTQPVSIANIANVEEAEAPTGFQTPMEPHMDDSGAVPVTIDEKIEMEEPAKADDVVHPDHKESFPEETSISGPTEEVVKVEDQQSQKSYTMDADVVQEEMLKCEETHVQEELPKSEAHEIMTNAQEMLNKESAEGIDAMNENNEETTHQSNMEAPKEITPELDTTTREPPINVQVQNHERSEGIEHAEAVDTEAEMQQRSVDFEDAILENQHNLGVTIDNDTVQEDTLKAIEQKDDGQQDQDLEPEKATEDTQPASMANSTDVEVVAEAPSGVQTPVEPSLDNSDTIPDTIDGNKETDEPAKADGVHPDHKGSSPEDAAIAEPTEEVAEMEEPQSQQADAVNTDVVQEEVPKFEHADEPATNAHEVLNQESTEETDGLVNEKTEETAYQSNMAVPEETTPENDTITGEPHVNIQVQNQESVDAEEVDTGAAMQQSSVAFDEVVLEDQHNLGVTMDDDTVQQDTVEATEQTKDPQGQDLEPEKANENTQPATMTNIPDVEVVSEASSGVQTPVEINLDNSDAIPDTADRNIEIDESAKAEGTAAISEPPMSETEEEPKDIEATEAREITEHSHVTPSKELSAEDDLTADETHELTEVKEISHEMNTTVFQTPTEEDNPPTIDLHESARELSNIEATQAGTPHQSDAAQSEEQAPEEIASEPQLLEPESVEEINDTTATEDKLLSSSGESVPEEIATEDNTSTEPDVHHQQVQDQESTDFMETEADKHPEIASSCILSTPEQSTSEDNATAIAENNATAMEPNSNTQAENLQPAEVTEGTENVKSNTALPEAAAPEENVETGVTADMPSVQEPELEETKDAEPVGTEDIMTPSDLPAGNMDMETMGAEAVPHESHVESTNELTEDVTEPVLELESFENKKCTDTIEHPGEPHGSTSDETTPTEENTTVTERAFDTQQVQNLTSHEIKDSEDAKTDEFSDLSSFPTEEADQESNLPRTEPATDVLQVQELGSTEETRDIESEGTEDHQQHGVSTFDEPAVDSEPNVDDQQVHEDKVPEVKDNEAMEAEEVVQQSNIDIPDDAAEERNELTSDPDSYVQPAQHVDSENSQLEKAEETAGTVTIEETPTEDSTASEIDPPVDIKQEHELEPVEEIKVTDANEAEEEFHTTQVDTIEKSASEGDMASIEPTSNSKQENELEATKEINGIEAVNDGEQAENATSEDPSTTDNETTPEGHSAEFNEEIMGNETDNVKDEIQTSVELKDGACDLGEAVLPTQGSENMTPKDEETENQKEEIQADEQKQEDKGDDFTMEPLADPKDIENGTKNKIEDTDVCEAEQTEALITEILKHEEAPHVSEESTPSSMDMEVDNVKGTDEGTEEDAGAKNDNKDEKETEENDDIVAKDSTAEHDETIYEITNEEVEPGSASSGQEASEPAPSNDAILENNPAAVTQNDESGEHREDKECTDKVNDAVHTIQASEEEIAGETNENKEIQNEDNAIHHDESQTESEKDEVPQLDANEPCNTNAKIDDTTTPGAETIDGNASINPREVEEIGENKGLDSTSEPFVESSIQNNVEQDLSRHHKVEDENLSMMEQNDVDIEAMQEKADESASDINLTKQCQEEISKDDGQQLEIEENSFDKIDGTVSHEKIETSTTEAVTVNDTITIKASGDDGGPSDGSLKTFNDTGRDFDVPSVITASKEESVNENVEDHKLEKTEREMPSSDKLLPTEPEENQIPNKINEEEVEDENQVTSEKNEEDIQDTETGDAQNDVEQELPVSNFLMNLILGKKNGVTDENSEPEAEGKQGETTEEDSFVLISKEVESVGPLCTENKVDENLTFEQEKHGVKCSEETQEMVKEPSDDLKMDIERSIHTDEESNENTQGNPQEKNSDELLLSEEASSVSTNMKERDIEISNFELDDKEVDTVCQENSEDSTKTENGSLKGNINDLTNTETSEEGTLGEQQTGLLHESLPEDNSADAVSAPLLVEPGVVDAKDSSYDAEAAQNLTCAKEDPTESSIIETASTPHIQLECEEVEKKEEEQHSSKGTENVPQEAVESSNDNPQNSTSSEVTPDEQAPHITEPVSDTEKILVHEKEICEGSTYMDEKENSNFSTEGLENFQTAVEIQADGANMQINQDEKNEVADNETAMGPEKLGEYDFQQQQETDRKHEVADNKTAMGPEKLGESDFQEHQETDTEQKSPKVGDQQFVVKKETVIKEQVVPETVESHEQTMSNEKQELFDSKVQERALNVVSPREASEAEENFVDVTKQEFSTDEEQSPKADADEKIYDEKIKVVEGTKDFTDGAATKTEAPVATQKTPKKLKLLSGVGSKVKHQLAKVKKAIVGKPGNTKPDSPKS